MKLALALSAFLSVSSVYAAPYYVGENLKTPNLVDLSYSGTPVKSTSARNSSFINSVELKTAYMPMENTTARAGLPFYFAPKAVSVNGSQRNTLGNFSLGGGYNWAFTSDNKAWNYGFAATGDVYLPTSRKSEGVAVAAANPTTDLFRYTPKTTSITPTVGAWVAGDMVSAKANVTYGYSYISAPGAFDGSGDKNRGQVLGQVAGTWNALPYLQANLEYNTILLDSPTRQINTVGATEKGKKFRHAVSPSVSGNYESVMAQVFATVPLDKTTRDITNVAFGLNAGYVF